MHLFVTISICANLMCTASTTFGKSMTAFGSTHAYAEHASRLSGLSFAVSVWGTGKALRGKDGSMDQAVDGMHNERAFIFSCFGVGLITTLLALMSAGERHTGPLTSLFASPQNRINLARPSLSRRTAWILMTLEVALVATLGISWCIFVIVRQARRIHAKFGLSKADVISFADIMQSPAVPAFEAQGHAEEDENAELIPSLAMSAKVRRGTYDV